MVDGFFVSEKVGLFLFTYLDTDRVIVQTSVRAIQLTLPYIIVKMVCQSVKCDLCSPASYIGKCVQHGHFTIRGRIHSPSYCL